MFDSIRRFALTIAATLIGVSNVACACPASIGSGSKTAHVACDTPRSSGDMPASHADMHGGMHHAPAPALNAVADHKTPAAPDRSECEHCNLAALAQSAAVDDGVFSSIAKIFKAYTATIATALPDFALSEVVDFDRGRWRAPPIATPVSLKIRLRN